MTPERLETMRGAELATKWEKELLAEVDRLRALAKQWAAIAAAYERFEDSYAEGRRDAYSECATAVLDGR